MKSTGQIAAIAAITPEGVAYRAKRLGLKPSGYTNAGMALWPESAVPKLARKPKRGRPRKA